MEKEIKVKKKKKKKKGFTLIELLAVILILGIIALIAIPTVNNVVEQSRRGAAERTIDNYIRAVEHFVLVNEMNGNKLDGTYTLAELLDMGLEIKGELPLYASVVIEQDKVTSYIAKTGNYVVSNEGTRKGFSILRKSDDTHLGIVYMDPTNINKVCTSEDAVNNKINNKYTGVKIGCMKWYILGETIDTYNLLLDHHTTQHVAWNLNGGNEMDDVLKQLEIDTKGWSEFVTPYIISKNEIDEIVNPTSKGVYCLDSGLDEKECPPTTKGESKYYWLFDNVCGCEAHGCSHAECTNHGYWTTSFYRMDASTNVARIWIQSWEGKVLTVTADRNSTYGLRPAIKISKVFFN